MPVGTQRRRVSDTGTWVTASVASVTVGWLPVVAVRGEGIRALSGGVFPRLWDGFLVIGYRPPVGVASALLRGHVLRSWPAATGARCCGA